MVKNHKTSTPPHRPSVEVRSLTDCKSLYDCLQKVAPVIDEKRTLIDVLSIKESIGSDGINWIPTDKQLADALTKIDYAHTLKLILWLGQPFICLRQITDD